MPRKRKTQDWESDIANWFKRHNIPQETIDKFIPYLWKKKMGWDLAAMKSILHTARHEKPSAYREPEPWKK